MDKLGETPAGRSGVLGLLHAGDVRGFLQRHADVGLAALVVVIVGMMIVPLPTFLLDLLICLNIAVAVTLLLVAIYVSDALKIATFPTLLLLTTLFRLALQVSATRLILLKADAGQVIHAFGSFVVAGNLVVGVVIFFIVTVVQFMVVARGSERVAEVGARFALDALPGRQMAIDAELRTGHIDQDEARRRRALLARESQFFGAMDGAMKFVKGDALAGIVVLLTNIVGGLVIGIVQRGMDAGAAARTYTLLTIGEGLVAQIPALIISTGAGLVVTRVSSADEGAHLGRDIGAQILGQPKALAVTAALLAVLAAVPGLPAVPFVVLAAALGFVAWRLLRAERTGGAHAARGEAPIPALVPIVVELGPGLAAASERLSQEIVPEVAARLFEELGLPLPAVKVRASAPGPGSHAYAIRLQEVTMGEGDLAGAAAPAQAVGEHLLRLLRRHGHEFLGIDETQALLDSLARVQPALVREVVPKLVPPALLAEVLRRLLEEGISVRPLREILGALAARAPERDPVALTEHVRAALRRQITARHAQPGQPLAVYLLDPMIEDTLRESVHRGASGSYLALEPALSRDIVGAVGRALAADGRHDVILTGADLRRHVRRLVEAEHPQLAVLSYEELAPEVQLRPLGHIKV
jgi:type III secretion protein V